MKEYGWSLDQAYQHVKEKRSCIKPNKGFMKQLETYQGILDARYDSCPLFLVIYFHVFCFQQSTEAQQLVAVCLDG
jgi:hypothetical protein